jgi:hypothetical protein
MHQNLKPYSFGVKKFFSLFVVLVVFLNSSLAQNKIVTENALPGSPDSEWDIPTGDEGDETMLGYATDISVNVGGTINFKVDVTSALKTFTISIYRIGYYGGDGARKIADLINPVTSNTTFTGIDQNACSIDNTTGLIDCGNWSVTAHWDVPSTAVSGLYIAKLTKTSGGGTSHIPFIVRDDDSHSDILLKTSDATWQAYNGYGSNSLYVAFTTMMPHSHANKVSYNRPFITRDGGGGGGAHEDWFMNAEYPMIRFLESNGYDISYTTDVDLARNNVASINLLLNHKVFLSVGHDEYWSKEERNSVEAAKAAGVNLAFFSGNEVYWKTRWENSVNVSDGSPASFRTMVCYKEGTLATVQENACGGKCDPDAEWTGLWRDGCSFPNGNACKPENALTGNISWDGNSEAIKVPSTYKNLRFWRNTPVAALADGDTYTCPDGTLGYEFDWEQFESSYPAGRITMSNTPYHDDTRDISIVHKLSLYKASSGAIVFGAGTVQWAWGLDSHHDLNIQGGGGPADPAMQQATINVLADMGAHPATPQSPLADAVQSTDQTPPVTKITYPVNGASLPVGTEVTITGTATDAAGVVAGVDVSLDGVTWKAATVNTFSGTTTWSFTWTPTATGNVTIRSRAFDDIGNLESPGGSEGSLNTVNVIVTSGTPPSSCPCNIFLPSQGPDEDDTHSHDAEGALTVGVKFRSDFSGTVSAIRFFKSPDDIGPNTVQLWELNGTLIGSGSATTTAGGWVVISLSAPTHISANTTYVASYFSPTGYYTNTDFGFSDGPVVNGPLTGIGTDDADGPNGVYDYGSSAIFPQSSFNDANYWVDVVFTPDGTGPDITPPVVSFTSPSDGATDVNVNGFVSVTFNEDIDPTTVSGTTLKLQKGASVVPATVSYTSNTRTATLIPSSPLDYSSAYTATVTGGTSGITDVAGNPLAADYEWSFTTEAQPPAPPDDGTGGPILLISSSTNPFSRYPVEILRAEGYNAFDAKDISEVDATTLNNYDAVILGQMSASALDSKLSLLSDWVNAGGTLVVFRPDASDAGLKAMLGITSTGGTLADAYLKVNTAEGTPGAGIVDETIQFHGTADLYTLSGATALATLYTNAEDATTGNNPAVTINSVGSNGGKAAAFTYDLARSVVYTRQGNPAYEGQKRDNEIPPIRSDDLFYPDYVNLDKVAIPQADEQQHLLTNIILLSSLHRKPMPHLWFLPSGFKAAVIMTGDDHANDGDNPENPHVGTSGTAGRFNEYRDMSSSNTPAAVADWQAIRGTSYIYPEVPISNDSVKYYQNLGFEIALHPTTYCENFDKAYLSSAISSQLAELKTKLPDLNSPVTNRTHCMPWSDWATQPKVENAMGMRFDVNYYYWPAEWALNRPGMFTGSGMPMRFADLDGTIIDCYQAPTQMPDESGLDYSGTITSLLDNAINKGYYGAFVMNMHTDTVIHPGSDIIVAAAQARNIPVISAKQMLTWLDTRNATVFKGPSGASQMTWTDNKLSFDITTTAHNLQAMVPFNSADGTLQSVTENGNPIGFTTETIKGISYGAFPASSNSYVAIYSSTPLPITLISFTVTKQGTNDALLKWTTSMEQNNKGFEIQRSTDASNWTVIGFVSGAGNSQVNRDYRYTDKNLANGTYYYRLRQVDFDGKSQTSKIASLTITGAFTLELLQNHPNPVINSTTIEMIIPQSCRVQLILYDQVGRPVRQLMDEMKPAGKYQVEVNKSGLGAGAYYYKLNAMGKSLVRKMTIL